MQLVPSARGQGLLIPVLLPSQELADTSNQAKPLRRRTLLLLGQWVTKLTADDRQLVYQAATQLLADADAAVQLAAVDCLHALVDDW